MRGIAFVTMGPEQLVHGSPGMFAAYGARQLGLIARLQRCEGYLYQLCDARPSELTEQLRQEILRFLGPRVPASEPVLGIA